MAERRKQMLSCKVSVWNGFENRIKHIEGIEVSDALAMKNEYRRSAVLFAAKNDCAENVIYSAIEYDDELDIITHIHYFKDTFISEDQFSEYIAKMPSAEFGVIYAKYHRKYCQNALEEEKSKTIRPITLKEANAFVTKNHRHHDSVTGCKFAIGLYKTVKGTEKLIGVAICGRPVSRHLDNGLTLEINRLCTTETGNCCSMLYGRCVRIAKDMGYEKVITYILESEPGISLKASGFVLEDECCGGKNWNGTRKRTNNTVPEEMKQRWSKVLAA